MFFLQSFVQTVLGALATPVDDSCDNDDDDADDDGCADN